jgi:hypothetical protein
MPRSSAEILSLARAEIARGRPRAALKELELARGELFTSADLNGLRELLELARGIRTLAPVDAKARERLLLATEENIEGLSPGTVVETTGKQAPAPGSAGASAQFTSYPPLLVEQILAPARAEIERQDTGHALRSLEKARRLLLTRADVDGLSELIELAQRLPLTKPRYAQKQRLLIDSARQNVRYLSRRTALKAGKEWSDPFATAQPKTKLPTLPPMSRREKLIAAAIVVALAGAITTWALVKRAPQRVVHAIKCPTGEQGGPTWSPDGKQIAFAKNGECGTRIVIVPAEGGPTRELTKSYGVLPDWSPDGQKILYRSRDGFSVVPVNGGRSRLLRSDDGDMGASWSPDGERIAFVHGIAGDEISGFKSTLYTMNSDGSGSRRLAGHSCDPRTPDWSPNGGYLVFACNDGVYMMQSQGGSLEKIIAARFSVWPISVSTAENPPYIAFGWVGVETAPTDGTRNPKVIAIVEGWRHATVDVAWSPDSKQIAFSVTDSGGSDGLYVIDRDGSHRRQLARF